MFTTSATTYPWSFVTQIFHNGQPSHSGDRNTFEVMTSNLTHRNHWFSSFLVSSNLYQGHFDRNHKLWNSVSTERYIYTSYLGAADGMLLHIDGMFTFSLHISVPPLIALFISSTLTSVSAVLMSLFLIHILRSKPHFI